MIIQYQTVSQHPKEKRTLALRQKGTLALIGRREESKRNLEKH
jgi:hypothetical protein